MEEGLKNLEAVRLKGMKKYDKVSDLNWDLGLLNSMHRPLCLLLRRPIKVFMEDIFGGSVSTTNRKSRGNVAINLIYHSRGFSL